MQKFKFNINDVVNLFHYKQLDNYVGTIVGINNDLSFIVDWLDIKTNTRYLRTTYTAECLRPVKSKMQIYKDKIENRHVK